MPSLKLTYFGLPGRAEVTRILLAIGEIPFEDSIVAREQWAELKPKTPFGQVPVLEVDGKMLAQSSAIEKYAAKLAGLYPSDPWEGAKVDEVVAFVQDIGDLFRPTYALPTPEEKVKARQDILATTFPPKFKKLESMLEAAGGQYFAGGKLSLADIVVYNYGSLLISGFLDGIPKDVLDAYPVLKAHHDLVAKLPAVLKKYAGETEGLRVAYKPLA